MKNPLEIPAELKVLTSIELDLMGRLKPYMKIHNITNSYGQASMKKTVTHFAQSSEEVAQHLPLKLIETDNIIVVEKTQNVDNIKQFQIRPKLVYEALNWLKSNNKLFRTIEIVQLDDEDFNLNNMTIENSSSFEANRPDNHPEQTTAILVATTFNQSAAELTSFSGP